MTPALPAPGSGIVRDSLRAQVAAALHAEIVSGDLEPGTVHSAPALAERFAVSATPVREAMLDLVAEGMIEPLRNKGFRVTQPTDAELDEITAVRVLLEPPAVADIARRVGRDVVAADVEALDPLAAEIITAAEAGDLPAYLAADRAFHLGLLALGGNRTLVETVGTLRARTRLYGLHALVEAGHLRDSALEHEELVDLVLARDAKGAKALMTRHLGHVRGQWAGR